MTVAPRAGPAPRNRCPGPNRGPGLRARDVGSGNATGPGTRTTEKNTSPWATMTWPVSVPTRALAMRGAEILVIPAGLNKRRLWGDLAGSLMGAQSRNLALVVSTHNMVEPGGRGLAFVAAPEELL